MAYVIQMKRYISDYPIEYEVEKLPEAKEFVSALIDTLPNTKDSVQIIIERVQEGKWGTKEEP